MCEKNLREIKKKLAGGGVPWLGMTQLHYSVISKNKCLPLNFGEEDGTICTQEKE